MKERPIIMGAESVRAILEGRKTQTRRVVNPKYKQDEFGFNVCTNKKTGERWVEKADVDGGDFDTGTRIVTCPYGKVGDRLWVREMWRVGMREDPYWRYKGVQYKADELCPENEKDELPLLVLPEARDMEVSPSWRPSIFMPRWASRITLEITDIRVERVQDITAKDATAEGVGRLFEIDVAFDGKFTDIPFNMEEGLAVHQFARLWDSINSKRGYPWESNPWVWVLTFKVVQ